MESLCCSQCNALLVKRVKKATVSSKIDTIVSGLSRLTSAVQDLGASVKAVLASSAGSSSSSASAPAAPVAVSPVAP